MGNVAKHTYYRDAEGNLTTNPDEGHFLVATEGAELTPEVMRDYPEIKGGEADKDAGDSTLSEAEAAEVEANRADVFRRRQAEINHGKDAGDPAKLRDEARKAALRDQSKLAAAIGKPGVGEDEDAVTGPGGKKSTAPAENKKAK